MHSPGGIPGISPAVTWNATAAERSYDYGMSPFVKAGASVALSLGAFGVLYRTGILGTAAYQATRPYWWAAYNVYKEQADLRHALSGGKFELATSFTHRPFGLKGFMHRIIPMAVPFPWFDFQGVHVEESSSQTYQQNGGSLTPPPLVGTDGWRESRPSVVSQGQPPRKLRGRSRQKRCPPGHRWNGSRCVRIRS